MDIRTQSQPATPLRRRLRIGALALALATLPAIGAGLQAQDDAATTREAQPLPRQAQPAPPLPPTTATTIDVAPRAMPAPPLPVEPAAEPELLDTEPAPIATLEPGEFLWNPEVATDGPVAIIVSLPEQRLHVYRDGLRIGVSTISSGKPGHETPTGVFPILQKREEHYSNLYDNAPMPFMQRLTWDGIALHAGRNPGHPASHGCVRLPLEFAELLFDVTRHGTTVVVADDTSHSASVVYPGPELPINPHTGEQPVRVDVAALALE